jgi:hypothetical protein
MRKKSLFGISILIFLTLIISACNFVSIQSDATSQPADLNLSEQDQAEQSSNLEGSNETVSYKLPKLILVNTGDEYGLTLYNLQGQPITELKTPGIGYTSSSKVHIAGPVPEGPIMTPLVYHSFENPESLLVNINDSISLLVNTPMFYGMAGAPGEPFIAYSVYEPTSESVRSDLYIGNLETLPTNGPIYSLDNNTDYYVINPLGITTESGIATKIWYTFAAWGIGGDIIYPVNQSLYSFDMTNGNTIQHLDKNCSVQGLSQDFTWAACRTSDSNGTQGYFIQNLENGISVSFSLDPSSSRGAGFGVFSPDNTYVAWLEASGSHMAEVPDYHSRIRIGLTSGGIIYDQADTAIATVLGVGSIPYMKPVGWLDTQTLLAEVSLDDYGNTALITINLSSGSINKIIDGSFIAFAYP